MGAVLGVLGSGPLGKGSAEVPGPLVRVEYQRVARYQTPDTLAVHLDAAATRQPEVRLGVDRRYLDHSKVEAIVPPPLRVEGRSDRLVSVFAMARPGEPLMITFLTEPQKLGLVRS